MRIRARLALVVAGVILAVLWGPTALGQVELISNGTFDANIEGWSASTSGQAEWTGAEGHAAPGALKAINVWSRSSTYSAGAVQCVNLGETPMEEYIVSAWVNVPAEGNNPTAEGYVRVSLYGGTDCTDSWDVDRNTDPVSSGAGWQRINKVIDVTTKDGVPAKSVRVRLYVKKSGEAAAYAYFDDVSLTLPGPTAVRLSSLTARANVPWHEWLSRLWALAR